MSVFKPNVPIVTREPVIEVEKLPIGRHRFQLVVVNGTGNQSKPDEVIVEVFREIIRTPVPPDR